MGQCCKQVTRNMNLLLAAIVFLASAACAFPAREKKSFEVFHPETQPQAYKREYAHPGPTPPAEKRFRRAYEQPAYGYDEAASATGKFQPEETLRFRRGYEEPEASYYDSAAYKRDYAAKRR